MDARHKDEQARLKTEELTRTYAGGDGVRDLDVSVSDHAFYALLGPNGAGKSTTLYLLLGLIRPDRGTVRMNGHNVFDHPEKSKRQTGVLLEEPSFYPGRTACENILAFHRHRSDVGRSEAERMIEQVGLSSSNKKVKEFSSGMKQRLGIARALAGDPDLVLLDEPTTNLDPEGRENILTLFERYHREENVSFLYCTHRIEEAERLCTHVGILKKGSLREQSRWPPVDEERTPNKFTLRINETRNRLKNLLEPFDIETEPSDKHKNELHIKINTGNLNDIINVVIQEQIELREVRPRTSSLLERYRNA